MAVLWIRRWLTVILLNGLIAHLSLAQEAATFGSRDVDFARDIKPILSANCFKCHGPDTNTREAELRFDSGRDSFASIIGTTDRSDLLDRLTSTDPDFRMPPQNSDLEPLSEKQIRTIRQWISQGANVETHWSYQPIQKPTPPRLANDSWSINAIDLFVLSRLRKHGLNPSAQADSSTLYRRLSLDLVGMPPREALGEDIFQNGFQEATYRRAIDRLLGSASFGERMAIDWLDLVRFADTSGIHSDNPISMSPYRDYVIAALNDDMPFDQFTREQLAGDLIPNATLNQKIASAYNRLNMMTTEGGAQDKEYLAKYAADRVRTTSTVWLGSTLGCAECHDHKYDPFTSREFYEFAAYFADITEKGYYPGAERSGDWGPQISVPTRREKSEEQNLENELETLTRKFEQLSKSMIRSRPEWIADLKSRVSQWQVLRPEELTSKNKSTFKELEDHSVLAVGKRPDTDTYTVVSRPALKQVEAIRLEVLPHKSLPKQGPGRAGNGNFVVSEIRCEIRSPGDKPLFIPFADAQSSFDQTIAGEHTPYRIWHAASAIDNDKHGPKPGWAVLPQVGKSNVAVFKLSKPVAIKRGTKLVIHVEQNHDNPGHVLGRFRLSAIESLHQDWKSMMVSPELLMALQKKKEHWTRQDNELIQSFHANSVPEVSELNKQIESKKKSLTELKKRQTSVLITVSRKPRVMRILPRGNWLDESGREVFPGTPLFPNGSESPISNKDGAKQNRMDLTNWITSQKNPLTARVHVNRLWKKFFGRGLVATTDDFGSQGSVPTHPELLDWLAVELIESGWSQKHLIRLIVESATYRQSANTSNDLIQKDIQNLLLGRQNAVRLDAEIIRDQALAASGLLVKEVGGRSVRPYQPVGYYRHLNFPKRTYRADVGSNQYRRGVYTHWQRLFLHPMLQAFDAPSREECTAQRVRSNTPQQAHVLLNDPSFFEAAKSLASRVIVSGSTFEDRLKFAYLNVLGRTPSKSEVEIYKMLSNSDQFRQSSEMELWTSHSRVLLNLHEFTTRN